MIDERLQELAALHALDLLEGAEKSAFESELARHPDLRALVRELRETSAALALASPQSSPPAHLKDRILARISPSTPNRALAPVVRPPTSAFRRYLPWAIAAGFALACAGLGQLYLSSRAQSLLFRDQAALADLELRSARQQLEAERLLATRQLADAAAQLADATTRRDERERELAALNQRVETLTAAAAESNQALEDQRGRLAAADAQLSELREKLQSEGALAQLKIATLASLAGNSPEALAVAVWNPSTQQGVLRTDKLPALASDRDYQLWVIDPAYPDPVDSGVFTVDPATGHARVNFRPTKAVANASKFAISLERKGGVPAPEGPIVLLGD